MTTANLFLAFACVWILLLTWIIRKYLTTRAALGFILIALLGCAYFSVIGASGIVAAYPTRPMALLIVLPILFGAGFLAWSRFGAALVDKVPLSVLIAAQSFRILVELFLHRFYQLHLIPKAMTFLGSNFDIATGLSALGLGLWSIRGALPGKTAYVWNAMGLALLVNVVVTGVLSAPGPLQRLNFDAPNLAITRFPYILVAGLFVASAFYLHLLTFWKLRMEALR